MRVGMVTGEYPPMQGGVGAFTREVARAMVTLGHEVRVFTRDEAQTFDDGVTVDAVVKGRWGFGINRRIQAWADAHQVDVVNVQYQTAAYGMHPSVHFLPSALDRRPTVVTFHDLRVPYLFPKAGRVRELAVKKLAADTNGCIATSREDEVTLRDEWSIRPVCWVPIGSNITPHYAADFNREAVRGDLGVDEGELLISYFGFLNESKGGLELIEALGRLRDAGTAAKVVMIGGRLGSSDPTNRDYAAAVDACITRLGLEEAIIWTGFVSDEEVSAYFAASDLSALPYRDGASLRRGTLMAALAHEKAIVTTPPQGDAPELDGLFELVPVNDAAALADGIARVWDDDALREHLERASRRAAQRFTWEHIAEQTLDFFESIL